MAADSGSVTSISGRVIVERAGQTVPLERGSPVLSGDTIVTGEGARVQIDLLDDGLLVIPANSSFRIDQFVAPSPQEGKTGRALFSVLKGGFRAVTGLIATINRDAYQVQTPVATMGVRGTDFVALMCGPGRCGTDAAGKPLPPGLYVQTLRGTVVLSNDGGRLVVAAPSIAYVAAKATAPAIVRNGPPFDIQFGARAGSGGAELEFYIDAPRIEPDPPPPPPSP